MKIDFIYPSSLPWPGGKGFELTLQRMGLLHKSFELNPLNYHQLFDYFNDIKSDLILLMCADHHMFFLHDSLYKQAVWMKLKVPTVCICWELILNSRFDDSILKSASALQCFDYFLYVDEKDINFFRKKGNNACFFPLWVDGENFKSNQPLSARKNKLLFFGKTTDFGVEGVYSERKLLLNQLLEKNLVDFPNKFIGSNNSFKELVELCNNYTALINLPSINGSGWGYSTRVYEAMACGNLLFQYRLQQRPITQKLFQEYIHYIPYNIEDFPKLVEDIEYYLKHWGDFEKITKAAREEVLSKHTIEHRIEQIIKFVDTGERVEFQLLPELKSDFSFLAQLANAPQTDTTEVDVYNLAEEKIADFQIEHIKQKTQDSTPLEFLQIQDQLQQAQNTIAAMETSKFWQLRKLWFKLKKIIGLPGDS